MQRRNFKSKVQAFLKNWSSVSSFGRHWAELMLQVGLYIGHNAAGQCLQKAVRCWGITSGPGHNPYSVEVSTHLIGKRVCIGCCWRSFVSGHV